MTAFLASNPFIIPRGGSDKNLCLDDTAALVEQLFARWPGPARCLTIASDPNAFALTDEFAADVCIALKNSGLAVSEMQIWDNRAPSYTASALAGFDLLVLAGGHVPTQNRFFREIGLREKLADYDGLILGVSAGSMNCGETVYAVPERKGEAVDPDYLRFLPGLGLADVMLIPHFDELAGVVLDGMQLVEDIICPDSFGRKFCGIPDGSFLRVEGGHTWVSGEAYLVTEGRVIPAK